MKIIVAGSRSAKDPTTLYQMLSSIVQRNDLVIQGGAKGADYMAKQWCWKNMVACREVRADWQRHGTRAGIIRNRIMAEQADALIAFWDMESRGTANMIVIMKLLGKPVHICRIAPGQA